MSFIPANNLVMANRAIVSGSTVANTAAKTYFQSKRTIPANTSAKDTVWRLTAIGSYKTALLATVAMTLEFNRSIIVPMTGVFSPVLGVSKEQWTIEAWVTKGDVEGTLIVNGRAGMCLSLGAAMSWQSMMMGMVAGIDFAQPIDAEISAKWSAANANNSITLEQIVWEELRQI